MSDGDTKCTEVVYTYWKNGKVKSETTIINGTEIEYREYDENGYQLTYYKNNKIVS